MESTGVRWRLASAGSRGDRDALAPVQDGVCVLGMHRSGTSLVAGLLGILGVNLGPEEELLPPLPANPKGYHELAELVEINDAILAAFGGAWDRLPVLPPGWQESARLDRLRERARLGLGRWFSSSDLWGWKDPRTCVTLPFWQRLVPGLRYVICVRNPVDVANSLRAREGDGHSWERGVEDWLRHVSLALAHTSTRPRLVLHYEDFFPDPSEQLRRLARFLGVEQRVTEPGVAARVREFVDPDLVHGRATLAEMANDPRVSPEAASLYVMLRFATDLEALRQAEHWPGPEAWCAIDRLAERLDRLPDEPA